MPNNQHHPIAIGKNIEKLRKIRGIKQEALAKTLGISRQSMSKIEQSTMVDDDKLIPIAEALGVTLDALKSFNEEAVIHNNIYDQNNTVINYNFNPIEKIVELYDKLLQSEKEKVKLLEKLLNKSAD